MYTHWSRRTSKATDLEFINYGSTISIYPKTDAGREWLAENVEVEDYQRFGESVHIDPRALEPIVLGAREAGLICNAATAVRTVSTASMTS